MANYINNKDFYQAMVEYKKERTENGEDVHTPIPEYVGKCILDIATRFATKPNFYGYTYKEEMVSDAIENCIQYINNFDPDKSNNPFAYFTQICYYAFVRRINSEKKQSYIKHKLVKEMPMESFSTQGHDDEEYAEQYMSYLQQNNEFDGSAFERKIQKRKKKQQKKTALEELMSE